MPDPVEEIFVEIYARADKLIAEAQEARDEAKKTLEEIGDATEEVEGKFDMLGGAIAVALGTGFVKIAQKALGAIQKLLGAVTGFVKQSIMLASRVDVLGTVLEGVGARAGYSADEVAEFEADVKSMGITTQAARQSLIMMAQSNVDWAYAADIARVAQNAATVAGINSSEAFERLIYAMSRGRTEIMTTMGIMVNFVDAETKFAAQSGRTRKELSQTERMQARFQGTMEAATAIQDAYTSAMEKAGKQMTSIPRYLEEIQLAFGDAFQTAYTTLIFNIKERLGDLLEFLQDPATKQALEDFGEALDRVLKLLFKISDQAATGAPEIVGFFKKVAVGIAEITQETSVAEQTVDNLWESLKQFATWWWAMLAAQVTALREIIGIGAEVLKAWLPVAATWALLKGEIDWAEWVEATDVGFATLEKRATGFGAAVKKAFDDAFLAAGQLLGVIEEVPVPEEPGAPRAPGAAPEVEAPFTLGEKARKALAAGAAKIVRIFQRFQKKIEKLRRDHAKKMASIDEKEIKDQLKARAKYDKAAEKLQIKFQKQRIKDEKDYHKERIEEQKDFNKQWKRLIRDQHQEVLDAEWDFRFQEEHLIAEGDTLALRDLRLRYAHEKEVRGREQQDARSDTEEDRREQEDDRRKDFQEAQTERDSEYREQLLELQTAFGERLAIIAENAEEARQKERENLAEKAADAQQSRDEELARIGEWLANVKGVSAEELTEISRLWAEVYGEIAEIAIKEGMRAHAERMRLLGEEGRAAHELSSTYQRLAAEFEQVARRGAARAIPQGQRGGYGYTGPARPAPGPPRGAQFGMDEIITRPTLILAGEGGIPEHVRISPLTGGFGSGRVGVDISGNITVGGDALSPAAASELIVVVSNAIQGAVESKMEAGV